MHAGEATLYEEIAARLEALIDAGTLAPGERIPSVRRLHKQWGVSVSTVLEAYRLLEDRGRIEARPQSGHYVRAHPRLPEPRLASPPKGPRHVDVTSLGLELTTRADDPSTLSLGAALPDASMLPTRALGRIMADVARRDPLNHTHAHPLGIPRLKRTLASRMVDRGCALGPDALIVTNGAQEALYLALRAVTSPGDVVAVESPTYFGTLQTLEALGLRALELRTHPSDGVELDDVERAIEGFGARALVLVPSFSNPLGACLPLERRKDLAALLARHEIPLIEDDVFGALAFDSERLPAVKAFDEAGLVLYLSSVSKTLSPGLRIGWIAPGRFFDRVAELKLVTSLTSSTVAQLTVADFLSSGGADRHLRRLRRSYRDNTERMRHAVERYFPEGTRVARPRGGLFLWVELPARVDSVRLFDDACERGITIAPGVMFSSSGGYRSSVRLNCGMPWSPRLEVALETLGTLARMQLSS